jgi:hypothetical protein
MRHFILIAVVFGFILGASDLTAQVNQEPKNDAPFDRGFAQTVVTAITQMQGPWDIKSATLKGANLPVDQFESLDVNENGMTLRTQGRTLRFEFSEFRLASRSFLMRCTSLDEYPKGLVYDVRMNEGAIKIRYRTDGASVAPEQDAEDDQLLVQTWTRSAKNGTEQSDQPKSR